MNADNGTAGGGPTEEEAGYSVSHSHYTFNGFGLGFYRFGGGDFHFLLPCLLGIVFGTLDLISCQIFMFYLNLGFIIYHKIV